MISRRIVSRHVHRIAGYGVAALLAAGWLVVEPGAHAAAPKEDASDKVAPASEETARSIISQLQDATRRWDSSCRKPHETGLCIEVEASRADPKACGKARLGRIRVLARKAKLAARAQRKLAATIEQASSVGEPEDDALRVELREALGQARLAQADGDFEAYLAVKLPKGLDFKVEEWKRDADDPKLRREYEAQRAKKKKSEKAFKKYFETKFKTGEKLTDTYADINKTHRGSVVVRAALRSAWIAQDFADQMRSNPVPSSLEDPDHQAAYCRAVVDQTETPRRMARERAQYCVDKADELKLSGPAVESCRALLKG